MRNSSALFSSIRPSGADGSEVVMNGRQFFVHNDPDAMQVEFAGSLREAGGVLGAYRFFFSRHHGVEADYGYALNTQNYGACALGVNTNTHEISGAYVFRMPFGKVTPFALAGVSTLVFNPSDFAGASTQTRAGFVYGAGADINLTHHVFMRAQCRGFVHNSPTYDLPALGGLDRVTHRAEPSVGFGYRF